MVIQGKPTFIFTKVTWLGYINSVVVLRARLHLAIASVTAEFFCHVKCERVPKVDSH